MAQASEAAVSAVAEKLLAKGRGPDKPEEPQDAAAPKQPRKANRKVAAAAPQPENLGQMMVDVPDDIASEIQGVLGGDMVNAKPRKSDVAPAELEAEVDAAPAEGDTETAEPESDEAPVEAADGSEAEAPIETLADIAQGLEMEESALLDMIRVPGPDGELMPLAQVLAEHKEAALGQNLLPQIEARAQQYEQALERVNAEAADRFGKLDQLTESLIAAVHQDGLSAQEWKELKQSDPAAYIARSDQYNQRRALLGAAVQQREAENQRQQALAEQQQEQWRSKEKTKILANAALGLKTPADTQKFSQMIGNYLTRMGFLDSEVGELFYDSRVAHTLWKANRYDEIEAEAKRAGRPVGQVKKKAPMVRADEPSAASSRQKKFAALRQRLSQTGDEKDLAAVLIEKGRMH